jgi:hypothetical protein
MQTGLSIELQSRKQRSKTNEGLNLISRAYQTRKMIPKQE